MFRILAVVVSGVLLVVSCRPRPTENAISPPETPLFVKEGVGYGVINVSFVHVIKEPVLASAGSSTSVGLLRKGSIVGVVERRSIPEVNSGTAQVWVFVEARGAEDAASGTRSVFGWLSAGSLDFYENLPKAETASALMLR
jgi:hypothetical protein